MSVTLRVVVWIDDEVCASERIVYFAGKIIRFDFSGFRSYNNNEFKKEKISVTSNVYTLHRIRVLLHSYRAQRKKALARSFISILLQ